MLRTVQNSARDCLSTSNGNTLKNEVMIAAKRAQRNPCQRFLGQIDTAPALSLYLLPPGVYSTSMLAGFTTRTAPGTKAMPRFRSSLSEDAPEHVVFCAALAARRAKFGLGRLEVPELYFGQPLARFLCGPFGPLALICP
ncbi:hypothetical protein TraAM80_04423 [Trypanosoma rangeli]|uniref:Uncharacterized protein n=1 Tax=Trypanosoma rangeli TaxID=5698 RepID=A0A3R7MGT8_TRYRA|nr:uncharacterized protein TraAM80_04423 [Trypanosoma rangeli]RNF05596.1 hypothetical protein TraAM80_04423 [Trypanosoma rangeli]|eukprot:RNF05596.1 hypothetical protein TraAM80_04423 [Trypanosoma rangeli]